MSAFPCTAPLFTPLSLLTCCIGLSSCAHPVVHQSNLQPVLGDALELDLGYVEPAALHHFLLGQDAVRQGDEARAAGEFRLSLVHDPRASTTYEALSATWVRRGQFVRAVETLERGLGRVDDDGLLHIALQHLHWQMRDYEKVLEAHAQIEPSFRARAPELQSMRVDALLWLGQREVAKAIVDEVTASPRVQDVPHILTVAGVLEDHAELDWAQVVYERALGLWPGSYDAAMGLVRLARWRGRAEDVHDALLALAAHQPQSAWVMIDLYEAAMKLGRPDSAQSYRAEALRRAWEEPRLLASLYHWLWRLGDPLARSALEQLSQRHPGRWSVRQALLQTLDLPSEAEQCLSLVKALPTVHSQAWVWQARCHAHRGNRAKALESAHAARDAGLDEAALNSLALELGRFETQFETAWDVIRQILVGFDVLALAQVELADDWGKGQQILDLIDTSPKPDWLRGLDTREAIWQVRYGDRERGFMDLEAALMAAPEDPDRLNALGFMLVEEKRDYREAEVLLRRAYRLDSEAGYILDSLGWLYWNRGDLQAASTWLRRALGLRPDDPEVLFHIAIVEHAAGRRAEARGYLKRALGWVPSQRLRMQITKVLQEVQDEQSP